MSQNEGHQSADQQKERLEDFRRSLRVPKYEYVRKEVLLNADLDINQLMDDNIFATFYAYRDPSKEKALGQIKQEVNLYQGIGVVIALPLFAIRVKTREVLYLLPAIGSLAGGKWYSNKLMYQRMAEQHLTDYWRNSKKLDGDLRKAENYIKQRNLLDKIS